MTRKKRPPLQLPNAGLLAVGIQVTVVTTQVGIAVDIDVKVADGPPGLEKTIGLAVRDSARAVGEDLAKALGVVMAEAPFTEREQASIVPTVAAARPGRG
jgi:hypothetical protein